MVVIKNFTLVAMPKLVANDPVAKRRAKLLEQLEAYPVDSGSPTCSVLSGCNRAVTRARFDGRRSFACPIPEGLC